MPPLSSTTESTAISSPERSSKHLQEVKDLCDVADDEYMKEAEKAQSLEESGSSSKTPKQPLKIVWRNVILFALLHLTCPYSVYLMFTSAKWQTNLFAVLLYIFTGLGVTAGVHRLWSHRSYKARFPLRLFLAFIYTIAFENDIYEWARDHRVHHKYSETDADPHNAKRGFFFAHIGWLLCRKHPDVIQKGKGIDLSDLMADPIVRFHRKYYIYLVLLCCFIIPTAVPMYFWGETFMNAFYIPTLLRLCFTLNVTWLVNSAAHMWGNRPYDVHISPRENVLVVLGAVGEGFHNYHHTFPYDYATSEYGIKNNLTTAFINLMAFFGLAYDLKTANKESIKARRLRTGEESLKMKQNGSVLGAVKED